MPYEENTPPEPLHGWEVDSGGTPIRSLGLTPGGTPKRKKLNAPRDRTQPINLEVVRIPTFALILDGRMRKVCACIALSKDIGEEALLIDPTRGGMARPPRALAQHGA